MISDVLEGRARYCILEGKWQDVLPADLRVDHVITDPPYSEHVHSKSRAGARKVPLRDGNGRLSKCAISREKDFGFEHITRKEMTDVQSMIEASCKRWALVFSDVESAHLWQDLLHEFEAVRTCFWHRPNGSPQFTGDRPGSHIEAITCLHRIGRKRWNGGGKGNLYTHNVVNQQALKRDNNTRSHPAQKPLDLMLALVADFTDPGDLILDPYCGSGTTGVACLRLGRRFIGCEMSPIHAATSRDRLTAEAQDSTLDAYRRGQVPLFGGAQ